MNAKSSVFFMVTLNMGHFWLVLVHYMDELCLILWVVVVPRKALVFVRWKRATCPLFLCNGHHQQSGSWQTLGVSLGGALHNRR